MIENELNDGNGQTSDRCAAERKISFIVVYKEPFLRFYFTAGMLDRRYFLHSLCCIFIR